MSGGPSRPPVLLIAGCHRYFDYLQAAIRRAETACKKTGICVEIVGVVGVVGLAATASFDATTRILQVPTPDIYEALPAKLHAAFCWIAAKYPDAPGIFKTDDDMLWNYPTLLRALTTPGVQATPYWGVAFGICNAAPVSSDRIAQRFTDTSLRPTHPSAFYCFGAGYWLSMSIAVPHLITPEATEQYCVAVLEDVSTGAILNRHGITPRKFRLACEERPRTQELLDIH